MQHILRKMTCDTNCARHTGFFGVKRSETSNQKVEFIERWFRVGIIFYKTACFARLFPEKGVVFLYSSCQAVMTNDQKGKKDNLHNPILFTRSCGTGFITQSAAVKLPRCLVWINHDMSQRWRDDKTSNPTRDSWIQAHIPINVEQDPVKRWNKIGVHVHHVWDDPIDMT